MECKCKVCPIHVFTRLLKNSIVRLDAALKALAK